MREVAWNKLSSDSRGLRATSQGYLMKKTKSGLSVRILEKEYQIACSDEEREDLIKAAQYLEGKLSEIANKGKIIGSERAAIMAALNISYEMMQSKHNVVQAQSNEKRIEKLHEDVSELVAKYRQAAL